MYLNSALRQEIHQHESVSGQLMVVGIQLVNLFKDDKFRLRAEISQSHVWVPFAIHAREA